MADPEARPITAKGWSSLYPIQGENRGETGSHFPAPPLVEPARWALYGGLLGLGAPAGLWLLLKVVEAETREDLLTLVYTYTTAATFVFAAFGVQAGRLIAKLRDASTHDALTGLPNRRLLMDQLPGIFANAERRAEPICVLMLDLDHFKRVNDSHGHAVGDKTLIAVARAVQGDIRLGDLVARYGGEEFVVVCPNTDEKAGLAVAERIRESVASLGESELGFDGVQTISIGLAHRSSSGGTPFSVLNDADRALYEAKSSGRDRVCVHRGLLRPLDSSPEASD
jgi:diguanylate cyclase (GGDEF)-like protein